MTLLITVFAAVIATAVWYVKPAASRLKVGLLVWMYWGASLMWLVDAIFEYVELKAAYFTPDPIDLLNDAFLGLSVVALALAVWVAVLLITDPNDRVKQALRRKK